MTEDTKSLLDQLKDDSILANVDEMIDDLSPNKVEESEPITPLNLSEEELGKFIIEQAGQTIKSTSALIARLTKDVAASGDPEQMSGLADLVSSNAANIEALNKIFTQNKKIKAAKELKQQEIDGKKEIQKIKSESEKPAGLIVANREEVFQLLLDGKKKDVIDVDEFDEPSDVEQTMDIKDNDNLGPA